MVRLKLKGHVFELTPGAPMLMGIVNIGSDSVADGRLLGSLDAQLEFAMRQHDDGAHIIDIGVQSGRTDTPVLSEDDEIERLLPLLHALAKEDVVVSVDTWRPPVAEAALAAGAALINDVSGLADARLADVAASSEAALVLMHTRAAPKVERFPIYHDHPMADVLGFLEERIALAESRGLDRDQIILDPGLDFSKTPRESVAVLRRLADLRPFNRPILLAVSRKYFIGMLTGRPPEERLPGTLAAVDFGVRAGAHILRVHDVLQVADYLTLRAALHAEHDALELKGDLREEGLKWLPPK